MAKIISLQKNHFKVSYLRINSTFGIRDRFCFPEIEDIGKATKDKVIGVLTQEKGTTKRQGNIIRFQPPLTNYNVH